MPNIKVSAVVFGSPQNDPPLPKVQLRLVSECLQAREIIQQAVKAQMEELLMTEPDFLAAQKKLAAQYLDKDQIGELETRGKIALPDTNKAETSIQRIDKEIDKALAAFEINRFKMFVDGEEVHHLNDNCVIMEGTDIKFLRLIPLVGG